MFTHMKAFEDKNLVRSEFDVTFERHYMALQLMICRKEKKLTQDDVSLLVGKSRQWVSQLENAKIGNPDAMALARLCMLMDISMDNCFSVFVSSEVADRVAGVQRAL